MNLRIPVVYCFNDDFTLAAGVSIYSLLTNANPDNIYEIYILYGNNRLSDDNQKTISTLETIFPYVKFHFINVGDKFNSAFEIDDFTVDVYLRLLIPLIIPNYEKIIYLDSDTIVKNDISELFHFKTLNFSIAAVKDALSLTNPNFQKYIKNNNLDPLNYINSGVLIFNNSKIRKLIEYPNLINSLAKQKYNYPDQDMLNLIFKDDICFLPSRFNYSFQHLLNGEMVEPLIIHFIKNKPWKSVCPFSDEWFNYYKKSPFYSDEYYFLFNIDIYEIYDKYLTIGRFLKKTGILSFISIFKRFVS